jgi:hypothetical protein
VQILMSEQDSSYASHCSQKGVAKGMPGSSPIHYKFAGDGEVTKRQSGNSKHLFHVSRDRLRSQLPLASSQSSRLRMLLRAKAIAQSAAP